MSHTRVLTFLGLGNYQETTYELDGTRTPPTTMHDAATTLRYGVERCSLVMLATAEVEGSWFDAQDRYRQEMRQVEAMPSLFGLQSISDGLEHATQMSNFHTLLRCLEPEPLTLVDHLGERRVEPGEPDTIVLDITYGWRSLPFFAAAVVMFARSQALRRPSSPTLRIIYSAFRHGAPEGEATRVCDLNSLVEVGDWNTALDALMRYGRADDFARLSEEDRRRRRQSTALGKLGGLVKTFADALVTTRTDQVITKASGDFLGRLGELRQDAIAHSPMLKGQIDLLLRWGQALHAPETVSHQGLKAAVALAELLIQLQRYAEAFATMRELLVTAWTLATVPEGEILQPGQAGLRRQREVVARDISWRAAGECTGQAGELFKLYDKVTSRRNDLLHGGFTNQPLPAGTFRKDASTYLDEIKALLAQGPLQVGPVEHSGPMVNFSNHPVSTWPPEQLEAALALGASGVQDVPFPQVDPEASLLDVQELAQEAAEAIAAHQPSRVFVAGEPTLAASVVQILQEHGVLCYSSTTRREAVERLTAKGEVEKLSRFSFVAWRLWPRLARQQ